MGITIKNTSNRPIWLNLPRERSLKIRSRDMAEVEETDLQSPEFIYHKNAGNLVILKTTKAPQRAFSGVSSEYGKAKQKEIGMDEEGQEEVRSIDKNKILTKIKTERR